MGTLMVDPRRAKFVFLCVLTILPGARGLAPSAAHSVDDTQGTKLTSPDVWPVILSDGWPIKRLVSNSTGDFAFAGGDFMDGADRLVLIKGEEAVRIAATGDPVPGRTGLFLTTVGIKGRGPLGVEGDFSLNAPDNWRFPRRLWTAPAPLKWFPAQVPRHNAKGFLFSLKAAGRQSPSRGTRCRGQGLYSAPSGAS